MFDSPATTGFIDERTGALFASDCFGAPLPTREDASSADVRAVAVDDLRAGQLLWTGVDSPWVHTVDPAKYRATIDPVRRLDPPTIFSSHLPPASGLNSALIEMPEQAPGSPPFVGPDQAALEAILAAEAV